MKKNISALLPIILILSLAAGCIRETPTSEIESDINVDVDLSRFSATIVHTELNRILSNPGDYLGKTIRMRGPYYYFDYQDAGKRHHYVAVEIADACCMNGLEFIWDGEDAFPDGYPPETARIDVIGVFSRYEEAGDTYYYLATDGVVLA